MCPVGGENGVVQALIDTDSQINVVKRGVFPEHVMKPAKKPLLLTLADGQPFWGGDREMAARLNFGKVLNHVSRPWRARANFYEGEIKADMILSLPWLAENGLDVLTKEGCLGERKGWHTFPITNCPDFENNMDDECQDEEFFIETAPSKMVGCNAPSLKPHKVLKPCMSLVSQIEASGDRRLRARHMDQRRRLAQEEEDFGCFFTIRIHSFLPTPTPNGR